MLEPHDTEGNAGDRNETRECHGGEHKPFGAPHGISGEIGFGEYVSLPLFIDTKIV